MLSVADEGHAAQGRRSRTGMTNDCSRSMRSLPRPASVRELGHCPGGVTRRDHRDARYLAWPAVGWKRRSRRLLATTNTELNAMAAPAISGLRNPSAASGIAAVL
jgi:hypothetical protein